MKTIFDILENFGDSPSPPVGTAGPPRPSARTKHDINKSLATGVNTYLFCTFKCLIPPTR